MILGKSQVVSSHILVFQVYTHTSIPNGGAHSEDDVAQTVCSVIYLCVSHTMYVYKGIGTYVSSNNCKEPNKLYSAI